MNFVPVPKTNGRVLTTMDITNDCFHSKGNYLYIGTTKSTFEKYGEEASPKMGHATLPVGETINASRDRYNLKDPFIVFDVITVNDDILKKFNVNTVAKLEEKIRKDNRFISNDAFDGKEYWLNQTLYGLINLTKEFIFDGKRKETYEPRIPQKRAIEKMIIAFTIKGCLDFLLGAIMRFGKNFTFMYAICEILKDNKTSRILIWSNRPSVFRTFVDDAQGHIKFKDYTHIDLKKSKDLKSLPDKCFVTASKQLLENNNNVKLYDSVINQEWDFIVIDESHSGIETERGQKFLNKFKNVRKIYTSGTPQKQLGKIQFNDDNSFIYDETDQKNDKENGIWPDAIISKTHLIKILPESVREYKEFVDDSTGYFTFSKFFSNNENSLIYEDSVLKFFTDFFGYNKFDDSYNFFGRHKHVFILMPPNVKSIEALKSVLDKSVFAKDYVVVAAAGDKFKREELDRALLSGKKTITLTCDKLIEGETVPEWVATINMSDGTSIFRYLQFAARPKNPDEQNPDKEAYFYDMNPQRHFLIQNEVFRLKGLPGIKREEALREYYKNFKIMIGENVQNMSEVDFDILKKDSYRMCNMMRSITSLTSWDDINLEEIKKDFIGITEQTSKSEKITLNDNGIDGGKNSKIVRENNKVADSNNNLTEKELEDIKSKWVTIMSRVPQVLLSEDCKTMDELLTIYRDLNGIFEGAFIISQKVFEKYWNNPKFIDKHEMDFYFKNFVESFKN